MCHRIIIAIALAGCGLLASLVAGAVQLPQGSNWTGSSGSTESYKDTASGLRVRVRLTAGTTGTTAVYEGGDTSSMNAGSGITTSPVLPNGTNALTLVTYISECQTLYSASLTCSGLGRLTIDFTDSAGNLVPVRNPRLHISRLGGSTLPSDDDDPIFHHGATLTLVTPGVSLGTPSSASLVIEGGSTIRHAGFSASNTSVACSSTVSASAGCGTVPLTGTTSQLAFDMGSRRRTTATRWDFPAATTASGDGYLITVTSDEDFGDAPASYEPTGTAAASHLVGGLMLGAAVTADNTSVFNTGGVRPSPIGNATATGDSNDDGTTFTTVVSTPGMIHSQSVTLAGTSRAGRVCGWIDFNRSGTFTNTSPVERACADFAAGATSVDLRWTVPAGTTGGASFARLRASFDTAGVQNPNGVLHSGEVEDYAITLQAATPLNCDATLYLTQTGGALHTINRSANPFTYPTLGSGGLGINAMGYNPADNHLYALRTQSTDEGRRLYRIDASGARVDLGLVSGLPVPGGSNAYFAGAFTTAGDNALYVTDGVNNNRMYRIDVTTMQATQITLSRNLYVADFDYANGLFYGIETNTGQLVSIHPANGTVTNIGTAGPTGVIAAVWADSLGLYGLLNEGGFYRFDTVTGARTLISDSPAAASSDGARCPGGPALTFNADPAITKTDGANTYTPGTNVAYTIVASNNGPFGAQNARVQDALPSGITTASWTCVAANGAACRTASGTGAIDARVDLPVGGTATFTLTMAVPTTFSGALTNTATIAVAPGNTDSVTTNNSATDTNQRAPRVTIAKNSVGGVGTFNFTGSNGLTAQAITTVTAGTAVSGTTQYLSAASTVTTVTEATPPAGFELTDISCTGLPAGGSATPNLATRTVTLNAAATAVNADVTCTFTNARQATLRLQKSLPNGRVVAGNQFTLSITGTGAPAAVTTTGTGTTANGTVTHSSATAGSVYTLSETAAGSPATLPANYTTTYSCTNARAGGQTPSGSGTSFTVTPVAGDDLTCTFANTARPANPLTCDATLYLTQTGGVLYTINRSSNPFTYQTLGTASVALNAMAYNPADNYLYALRNLSGDDGRRLYRIDASGNRVELGLVNGLPALPTGISYFAAAFTTAGDNAMYVQDGTNGNQMYRIDVTTLQATLITLSRNLYVADFDYIGGLFYGIEGSTGQLVSIHPVNGTVTNIGTAGPIGTVGAVWADSLGLYGVLNAGGFYRFDTVTGARTLVSDSPPTSSNDGARCPLGPALTFNADLAITKTNTSTQGTSDLADDTYAPGESRTYTIVVTNNGPFGAQNLTVSDPLPTGITTASWTCASTSGDAVCGAASGTNAINDTGLDLPVNAVATYTLTFTVPTSFTGTLTNVANVTPGAGTTDPTSGNNSATDADTRAPQLTLAKSWVTARVNDAATITATGTPSPIGSGALNAVANTATETDTAAGRYSLQRGHTYTITEAFTAGNAASYAKSLSCTGNTGTGAALAYTANALSGTLTVGSTATDITCTFANSGRATLTLLKTVVNDNDGTQLPNAWTLTATGPTNISGTTGAATVTNASVNPGTYTLAESATPTGYTASLYSCVKNGAAAVSGNSLVLAAGDTATCTITNNDRPATLTLIKAVINDNGGTQPASAWTLSATGPTNISGATGTAAVTNASVNPGTYALAESATPVGYTASPYSCIKNGAAAVSGNSLVLAAGDTATCTINNNDRPATLTLVKTVTNDNGGTQAASAWTLTATGPTNISGATGTAAVTNASVNPGTYTLAESATPLHYVASPYNCVKNGAAAVSGNSLVLAAGDTATCTINNNDSNQTDVQIEKTATPSPVRSGERVQFTLVVTNRGPAAAAGAVVRDPAVAGLDCTAAGLPLASCSASGGATCPASTTASGLQTGVAIPVLPNGGTVTIQFTCNVTASGLP
ncbi:GEVED domain-containing protein [Pseudoxanthomonas sp. PXM01]|uniref:DUF6923 family protein n=1 Tax=Pseudoxanthomonas sp. PXM01 TaxID=2769295 RepID=UPI001786CD82|nr:GEVED domain-containing protein [Pseudoxanthomonas sp. PXM01]MBD9470841.1 DUF11 domain-containing protein [Pseudoxanthomonas sp. PXM01]